MENDPGNDAQDQRGRRRADPLSKVAALRQLDTYARRFAIGAPTVAAVNNIATLVSGFVPGPLHLGLLAGLLFFSFFVFAVLTVPTDLTAKALAADSALSTALTEVLRSEKRLLSIGAIFWVLSFISLIPAAKDDAAMLFQIPLLLGAAVLVRRRYVSYVKASHDAASGTRLRPLLDPP